MKLKIIRSNYFRLLTIYIWVCFYCGRSENYDENPSKQTFYLFFLKIRHNGDYLQGYWIRNWGNDKMCLEDKVQNFWLDKEREIFFIVSFWMEFIMNEERMEIAWLKFNEVSSNYCLKFVEIKGFLYMTSSWIRFSDPIVMACHKYMLLTPSPPPKMTSWFWP